MKNSVQYHSNEKTHYFHGKLDGDFSYGKLENLDNPITINLSKVTSVSETGAIKWVETTKLLHDTTIEIEAASIPFMDKCDEMSSMITGNVSLRSLLVPYICSFCDHVYEALVKAEQIKMRDFQLDLPASHCTKCGNLGCFNYSKGEFIYLLIDGL